MIEINGFVIHVWWVCGDLVGMLALWVVIFFDVCIRAAAKLPKGE